MVRILHWNTGKSSNVDHSVSVCIENDVDIVVFSEFAIEPAVFVKSINKQSPRKYIQEFLDVARLTIFSRYEFGTLERVYEDRHMAIHHVIPPLGSSFLVASAHLPSKLWANDDAQYLKIRSMNIQLLAAEEKYKHSRSIVIGDLNANPFDKGMMHADGFHAVMDRFTALKKGRVFQEKNYKYFYNPMWNILGDDSNGPPGTYHYHPSGLECVVWNTFDQILIRPDMLQYYNKDSLKIITEITGKTLYTNCGIDKEYSDHLPIMIQLDITKENENV